MCINHLENDEDSKNVPYHVIAWILSWTSVFINPLIYGFSKKFWKGLKKAVQCNKKGGNGLQNVELRVRTHDQRSPRTPRTPNTQPKCLRTLDWRTPNRTPTVTPNRTPNRTPNGTPNRSPNRTPNRTPNIQLRFTQYQSHFYLPSPSQIESTH